MTKDVVWANSENPSSEAAIELDDRSQLMLGFTENLLEAIRPGMSCFGRPDGSESQFPRRPSIG